MIYILLKVIKIFLVQDTEKLIRNYLILIFKNHKFSLGCTLRYD